MALRALLLAACAAATPTTPTAPRHIPQVLLLLQIQLDSVTLEVRQTLTADLVTGMRTAVKAPFAAPVPGMPDGGLGGPPRA